MLHHFSHRRVLVEGHWANTSKATVVLDGDAIRNDTSRGSSLGSSKKEHEIQALVAYLSNRSCVKLRSPVAFLPLPPQRAFCPRQL
nr:hypothetical protein CFP56_71326 [Quercus suber]